MMTKNLKKFYPFDEDKPLYFRDGTSDAAIIQEVIVERKGYLFPTFKPNIVFDIGGNIGVVAVVLANIYPHATIYTFEPEANNFEILLKNVAPYKNIKPKDYGLGALKGDVDFWPSEDPNNFGGFSTHIKAGSPNRIHVESASAIATTLGPPDLIKIDCEGAEYGILHSLTLAQLDHVKWISGELHGVRDFQLLAHLDLYFEIMVQRQFHQKTYPFHAMKRGWTPSGP